MTQLFLNNKEDAQNDLLVPGIFFYFLWTFSFYQC